MAKMVSDRGRKMWWLSLASLPLLVAAAVVINAWRNIDNYRHRIETDITQGPDHLEYAGATWRLQNVRLLGDGRDTQLRLPGQMRLVIVRMVATALRDIGDIWGQCEVSLTDGAGRRWLPLDVSLSNDISRDLEPDREPVSGCGITSLKPPRKDHAVLIEEKFVVPAEAVPALSVRLSTAALRPEAIGFPLDLD
ncbi:hypothetical protein HFO55_03210 [Rhizobium leguminosarum]|uniref:hypothetical protein n=1 Tax=Rhizobium leguminosarum TaxID=384 RepID=UPI001C968B33|nr:hypothetical protein [Rhizobium leguminosarum]MBY5566270.1 hypothetical protein [Rhizobium leguminosarum]MBY5573548.1 hypothetical protein [Rhizobium leguminosarum]